MTNIREKIKNAYLVFYERVVHLEETTSSANGGNDAKKEESKNNEMAQPAADQTSHTVSFHRIENPYDSKVPIKPNITEDCFKEVAEENQKHHLHKIVFSKTFFNFMGDLSGSQQIQPNDEYVPDLGDIRFDPNSQQAIEFEAFKAGTLFFLTCVIREKERNKIFQMLPWIKAILKTVKQ